MSEPAMRNLFDGLPDVRLAEKIEVLHQRGDVRVERIVSLGQVTPPGEWFDQPQAEWVIVLRGAAELLFEGDAAPIRFAPGDHVLIAPHRRHRVTWTDPLTETVWLAVHMPG